MVKYFLNLSKLKIYAEMFKNNPTLTKRPLIAVIGSSEDPLYLVFLDTNKYSPGFKLSVESAINFEVEEYVFLNDDNWIEVVKRTVDYYNKGLDGTGSPEEDDGEDCEYICDNPKCVEYGNVVDVIKDEFGRIICPHCGDEISVGSFIKGPSEDEDEEDDEENEEIDRERLAEIAWTLIEYAVLTTTKEVDLELLDFLGIDYEEYKAIKRETESVWVTE